ncbi:unnamed protein product [Rotaria socialis]|uniref:Protein CNPPD1 n=3 Tax=Rotaria socialis TaxID=392032 RepID=A0A817WBM2_9BILA|nr:unnamed protein product [Rotaria socialis]
MIYRLQNEDLILDDIILPDINESPEQTEHLVSIDCAVALSLCKIRNLPSCVFVLSLLYMKRLRSLRGLSSLAQIDNLTTEELYITSTLLADKYLIDEGENEQLFNSDLAELAGITVERFNLIERQALLALNWNLYVSDSEFHEFLSLFKSQMAKTFNEDLDPLKAIDLVKFLSMCFKFLLHTIEYCVWISLLLIGASLSTLISIHFGALTHSTSIKTCNSTINCAPSAVSIRNNYENKNYNLINYLKSVIYALIESDSIYNNGDFNLSPNKLHDLTFHNRSCNSVVYH